MIAGAGSKASGVGCGARNNNNNENRNNGFRVVASTFFLDGSLDERPTGIAGRLFASFSAEVKNG